VEPATVEAAPAPKPPRARVTDRPGNPDGQVLIVEYHHIREGKGDMFRTTAEFRRDLERFYKMGFRPVTVGQYLAGEMDLPPGASPMVFTFDDSSPSQFRMLDDGTVDPESGVGIWMAFAEKHPDFPVRATWYVLPDVMWAQPKWVDRKVELLREMGSELGNHTVTHRNLSRLSDEEVKKEFAGAIDRLEAWGEKSPVSLALPLGIFPKNRELVKGFEYGGKRYEMKAAMLVGANPAPPITSDKFNPYAIPRIQATTSPFGIDFWLEKVEKGEVKVYVEP
jgi:hypothetical protein